MATLSRFGPSVLSLLMVSLLLMVLILNNRVQQQPQDLLIVRSLDEVVVLPPPPPPPSMKTVTEVAQPSLDLSLAADDASAPLIKMSLAKVEPMTAPVADLAQLNQDFSHLLHQADALDGFKLADLDGNPRLLTALKIKFPKMLKDSGIKKVKVKLHVLITQQGRVRLKRIVNNPNKALVPEIKKMLRLAKFTVPKREGKPVRAEFIWPIVLKES